jgi:hypothetical protein
MSPSPLHPHERDDGPLAGPVTGPLRPGGRGAIPFSRRDDIETIRRDLLEGEQLYGTFGDGTGDIALLGITNRRLMFVNMKLGDDRVGLTSVALGVVVACSYITPPDGPLTHPCALVIQVGAIHYEMGCVSIEEARDIYDLIMWHRIGV